MKNSKLKKILLFSSMAFALITYPITASASIKDTKDISQYELDKAKDFMLEIGLNKNFVKNAPTSEVLKYVDAKLITNTSKYYRINKDPNIKPVELSEYECYDEISNDTISNNTKSDGYNQKQNSWLKMEVKATSNGSNQYLISNACTWLKDPFYRRTDIIGLGHDTHLSTVQNTAYFYSQCYKRTINNKDWVTSSSTSPKKEDTGGTGFTWTLPSDSSSSSTFPVGYSDFYCYMSYTVKLAPTNYSGPLTIFGDYQHQEKAINADPSFSYPSGGSISVKMADKFDSVQTLTSFNTY